MERDNRKVYELIRKQLLEIITSEEEIELAAIKEYYTEDEYDRMMIQVLRELECQLPPDALDAWAPDYDGIRRRGNEIRKKRKINQYFELGFAAATLLFIGSILFYLFYPREQENRMLHLDSHCLNVGKHEEIPLLESSALLLAEDSTWIKVGQDTVGELLRLGELTVIRTETGLLRILRKRVDNSPRSGLNRVEVVTVARQQCVVELEDGTRIRLNAQSRLSYPAEKQDTVSIYLKGEAYVNAENRHKVAPLVIYTDKGKVTASAADFLIRSDPNMTKTLLEAGNLHLHSFKLAKGQALASHGDLGFIGSVHAGKNEPVRDTMSYAACQDFEAASMWTRKLRVYKNMPLRAFVDEMSRWEGFTIKKWDCIPRDKYISVSICYQTGRDEVYSAIRQAGVLLHEERGMISFCPEDKHNRVAIRFREDINWAYK